MLTEDFSYWNIYWSQIGKRRKQMNDLIVTPDEGTQTMLQQFATAYENAKNAIAERSTLAARVKDIEATLAVMQREIDSAKADVGVWRDRYNMLESHHARVLAERDQAQMEVEHIKVDLGVAQQNASETRINLGRTVDQLAAVKDELETVKRAKDDWELKHMLLAEEHEKAKAQLRKIHEFLNPIREVTQETSPTESEHPFVEQAQETSPPSSPESSEHSSGTDGPFEQSPGGGGSTGDGSPSERWPSSGQPHEPGTGRFTSYPKAS